MKPAYVIELLGLVISVMLAFLPWMTGNKDRKEKIERSVLVGMMGVALTLVASVRYQELPDLSSDWRSARYVMADPDGERIVEALSVAMQADGEARSGLYDDWLDHRIREFVETMDQLRVGDFTVRRDEIPAFALKLIEAANASFYATSYIKVDEWWNTPWGKRYTELNKVKAASGVDIRRIFIFSNEDDRKKAQQYMEQQVKDGITVYTVYAKELDAGQLEKDLAVVDDKLAVKLSLSADKGLKDARCSTQPTTIEAVADDFHDIQILSEKFVLPPEPPPPVLENDSAPESLADK